MSHQRDNLIAQIAAAQHGVVTRAQVLAADLSEGTIDRRVSNGYLKRIHPGVYRVGPIEAPFAREIAAVLACGAGAVLSHRSAGWAWGLLPPLPPEARTDVIVCRDARVRLPGIATHRIRGIKPEETTHLNAVAVTTPARTLFDLAGVLAAHELERALARGERLGHCDAATVLSLVIAHPRYPGNNALRRLLARSDPPAFTRSDAEALLLQLVRKARLPAPRTNAPLRGLEVDFLWTGQKLVVEVDGYAFHGSQAAFARDRRRDAALTAAGFRVMRFTWNDLQARPEATIATLAQALVR